MKKKIILIFLLFSFISLYSFAQNTDLKYYSDWTKDFSGYAVAIYQGNLNDLEDMDDNDFFDYVADKIGDRLEPVKKLTKKNNWLYQQALNEWDYEKDECYIVMCADSPYSKEALIFFVIIKGKNDFSWQAYNFKLSDMDKFDFE